MVNAFHEVSPGFTIAAWVNCLPPGSLPSVIENGYDYTPYCAKPFAIQYLSKRFDYGILLDAAFYPIRHIHPLVEHIGEHGYYLCDNGARVGEWANDRALQRMETTRDGAMSITEASSYCVGLDFSKPESQLLVHEWCRYAADTVTFPGPHTNVGHQGRNIGWCSDDPRCKGHRHDQSVLSIIAHRLGMSNLVARPKLTAYLGSETAETVLVNHGGF